MNAAQEQHLRLIATVADQLQAGAQPQTIVAKLTAATLPEEAALTLIAAAQRVVVARSAAAGAAERRPKASNRGLYLIVQGMAAGGLGLFLTVASGGQLVFTGLLGIGLALTLVGGVVLLTGNGKVASHLS